MNRCLLLLPFRAARAPILLARVKPLQIQSIRVRNASSVAASKVPILRRMKRFWDENPFTQIALLVCVLVVGVASLVEWTQNKRRSARFGNRPVFPCLPPLPSHPVLPMEELVALIERQAPSVRLHGARVVSVVGASGAGKSELARQVADKLMLREKHAYRPEVHVLTLDMSSGDGLRQSLLKCAARAQIPQSQLPGGSGETDGDEVAGLLAAISERLKRKQVVCILDNATDASLRENAVLFSNQHWKPPSLFIVTSRRPIERSTKLEINLDDRKLGQDELTEWVQLFGIAKAESEKLANNFLKLRTNFEAFSLISHCLSLLRAGSDAALDGDDLQSIVSAIHRQLPSGLRNGVDCLGYSTLDPQQQLRLVALTLFSASDQINQHSVDLFARLSPDHALPLSSLVAYLDSPFYELQDKLKERKSSVQELDHGSEEKERESSKPESEMGYWEFIKHVWKQRKKMLELMKQQQKQLNTINRVEIPTALLALKESPLFCWESDPTNGFESVRFRKRELSALALGLFQQRTVPRMEEASVQRARSLHASSLLSKLSSFSPSLHLIRYRAALPGLAESPASDANSAHKQSLQHRITQALIKDFDSEGEQVKQRLIAEHGDFILRSASGQMTQTGVVTALRLRAALQKYQDELESARATLQEVASLQQSKRHTPLVELARTYAELGRISLLLRQDSGHQYYAQAINLFERTINTLTTSQQVEYGSLLYRYGVEMSYEKKLDTSKSCLEKSLAILNVAAAGAGQSGVQALVLGSMVELAHVYLALGAHAYAEKLLNMAETLGKSLGGSLENAELAQLYNLRAVLRSLGGDKRGYVSLKQQAGDVLAAVEAKPYVH